MKTVGLELSKQLKEAGYPQKGTSLHRWMHASDEISEWRLTTASNPEWIKVENFAAPTADEILDLLPVSIRLNRNEWLKDHSVFYQAIKEELGEDDIEIEANSLADMNIRVMTLSLLIFLHMVGLLLQSK